MLFDSFALSGWRPCGSVRRQAANACTKWKRNAVCASFCTRSLQAACAAEWLQHLAPRAISRSWSIGKWLTQNSSFLHGSTWHLWIACPEGLHRWVHDSDAPHTRWCACCGFLFFFFLCINAARKQSRLYGYVPCPTVCSLQYTYSEGVIVHWFWLVSVSVPISSLIICLSVSYACRFALRRLVVPSFPSSLCIGVCRRYIDAVKLESGLQLASLQVHSYLHVTLQAQIRGSKAAPILLFWYNYIQ